MIITAIDTKTKELVDVAADQSGAVITRRKYAGFVNLFKADAEGDNGYGIAVGAYTDYVTVDNADWMAYLHFFYKSSEIGSLYYSRADDEGHVSTSELSIGGVLTTAATEWKDNMISGSSPFGKTLKLRIKNTGSSVSNYWLKMAGIGV
ncbi:MAG: hypothetical protein ABFD83_14855 [Armatimonadota bacterium]